MFNPDADYGTNAQGEPEFGSIILHVDPAIANIEGDQVVQKIVLSTENAVTSLTKVAAHFGEPALLSVPANASLLMEAGRTENPVFIYTTKRNGTVLLIMGTPTWDGLVQHPDFGRTSSLIASEKLQEIAATLQQKLADLAGGFSPLLLIDVSADKFAANEGGAAHGGQERGDNPPTSGPNERVHLDDNASSEGGAGSTAQSLRDTADIEQV